MKELGYSLRLDRSVKLSLQAMVAPIVRFVPRRSTRRLHAFCVGLPRSGTHSIANMFSSAYRSPHEPRSHDTIVHIVRYLTGRIDRSRFVSLLRARDLLVGAEMESAHYLNYIVGPLAEAFPEAKFVITIRDPMTWIASEINQNIVAKEIPIWRALEQFRYERYRSEFSSDERSLASLGSTYPIRSYLMYWREHFERVVDSVPAERLLVVKTGEIDRCAKRLSAFLSIPKASIDLSHSHEGQRSPAGFDLYSHVDRPYVAKQAREICGGVLDRLEIRID